MIRFYCEHCGRKISVQDKHAGKRGKCPACDSVLVVPEKSTIIDFRCEKCGQKISIPEGQAGTRGKCPKCKHLVVVPKHAQHTGPDGSSHLVSFVCSMCDQEIQVPESSRGKLIECPLCGCYVEALSEEIPAERVRIPLEPPKAGAVSAKSHEEPQKLRSDEALEEDQPAGKRKLPWIVDTFLYPISRGGLSTIGIILLLTLLTDFAAAGLLVCCGCVGWILGLVIRIIISYSYMYWYFTECVRDSATGGLRAPVVLASMPGLGAMIWHFLRIFACYAFTLGPVTFYWGYTYYSGIERNNVILLALLTYGMFFFPMGILAVVMFDSVNGLKPTLLVRSIASTFFHYCGLVILFYGLGILFDILCGRIRLISIQSGLFSWLFLAYIFSKIFLIYFLIISGYLLGRFFYRYEDKLYWEV
jgi:DNA-directed RNA polymerase subunit RPC12/RpoP